ncbi:hypothetical protein TWF102_007795 [Orbilia oligospora]|nr:hypothetical protein TWF102_007795 [Orbilia oligospora]KAF3116646.1 hypothetical protein TWF103_008408 [Orbilia oligospora]
MDHGVRYFPAVSLSGYHPLVVKFGTGDKLFVFTQHGKDITELDHLLEKEGVGGKIVEEEKEMELADEKLIGNADNAIPREGVHIQQLESALLELNSQPEGVELDREVQLPSLILVE